VTKRCIEIVIDRLMTDEVFRRRFLNDPNRALVEVLEGGTNLSGDQIAALVGTDSVLWEPVAALCTNV
jgi:hypothetical protein